MAHRPSRPLIVLATCLAVWLATVIGYARIPQAPAVAVDADDIGGVVTGPKGPEAGVWVIAETRDLGTPFNRTVVTDDRLLMRAIHSILTCYTPARQPTSARRQGKWVEIPHGAATVSESRRPEKVNRSIELSIYRSIENHLSRHASLSIDR